MVIIRKVILFISAILISASVYAQKPKYEKVNFKVWGKCDMCKTTIEKAAKSVKGVKTARWNMSNGKIKVKFNPEKTTIDQIQKSISDIGYDTEKFRAEDTIYDRLHYCC